MIDKLEMLLRTGKIKEVQSQLEQVELKKIERDMALKFANVSRRVGFNRLAFKILNPIVRPKNKLNAVPATPQELVEYGIVLFRLGVVNEARRILSLPELNMCPESKLYLAFTYFGEWDYEKARTLIENYTATEDIAEYDKAIGMVNLAQAYIGIDNSEKAISIISETIKMAKEKGHKLILVNSLQTFAEALIELGDYISAKQILNEIENIIGVSHYRYNLYLQKNLTLIALRENQTPAPENIEFLKEVGRSARKGHLYELSREIDFVHAQVLGDDELFRKVYYGTPYPAYRNRMLKHWKKSIVLPDHYIWNLNPLAGDSSSGNIFDIFEGAEIGTNKGVKKGSVKYRLLSIFSSNFYKSFKTDALFSLLFPNDYLSLNTSSHRVHDSVNRTQNWIKENDLNFFIDMTAGEYCLKSEGNYSFKIPKDFHKNESTASAQVIELINKVGNYQFDVNDAASLLKISLSTANRRIREAIEQKAVEKVGQGRATRYKRSS